MWMRKQQTGILAYYISNFSFIFIMKHLYFVLARNNFFSQYFLPLKYSTFFLYDLSQWNIKEEYERNRQKEQVWFHQNTENIMIFAHRVIPYLGIHHFDRWSVIEALVGAYLGDSFEKTQLCLQGLLSLFDIRHKRPKEAVEKRVMVFGAWMEWP